MSIIAAFLYEFYIIYGGATHESYFRYFILNANAFDTYKKV